MTARPPQPRMMTAADLASLGALLRAAREAREALRDYRPALAEYLRIDEAITAAEETFRAKPEQSTSLF